MNRPYRLGDQVQTGCKGLTGVVVAYRNISPTRQVLTVRTTADTLVPVTVDVAEGIIVLPPSSIPEAVQLAHAIVAGREPHMAVTAQVAILASAVISLAGGAQ